MQNHLKNNVDIKIQEIVAQHVTKEFGHVEDPIDIDALLKRYQLFPNEALYIVDAKEAKIEFLTHNFKKITGIETAYKNELDILFEHIHDINTEVTCHWVDLILRNVFYQQNGFIEEGDVFKCLYRTHHKKTLLKCTTALQYDSNGVMRYSLGKLIDITDLVPFQHFSYQYQGPNSTSLYEQYKASAQKRSALTKRETQILQNTYNGLTSDQIAEKLFISVHTVDTHRRNIIQKTEVKTTTAAYIKCKNLGWL